MKGGTYWWVRGEGRGGGIHALVAVRKRSGRVVGWPGVYVVWGFEPGDDGEGVGAVGNSRMGRHPNGCLRFDSGRRGLRILLSWGFLGGRTELGRQRLYQSFGLRSCMLDVLIV